MNAGLNSPAADDHAVDQALLESLAQKWGTDKRQACMDMLNGMRRFRSLRGRKGISLLEIGAMVGTLRVTN